MAHQWFGDIVTTGWWDDLWLNESFAEYMGNRVSADATAFTDNWVDDAYARHKRGLVADQRTTTHPVAGNGSSTPRPHSRTSTASLRQGLRILRQLNATVGDEDIFEGTVDHIEGHRFGNATMHDLFDSWERAGAKPNGTDLSSFTDNWLRTAGPDRIQLDRAAGVVRLVRRPRSTRRTGHTGSARP